jgi:hypothetical protein
VTARKLNALNVAIEHLKGLLWCAEHDKEAYKGTINTRIDAIIKQLNDLRPKSLNCGYCLALDEDHDGPGHVPGCPFKPK